MDLLPVQRTRVLGSPSVHLAEAWHKSQPSSRAARYMTLHCAACHPGTASLSKVCLCLVIDTLPGAQDSKGKDSGLPSRCTLALAEEAGTGAGYQKITMQDAKIERQLIVLPSCDTFQPWQ
uniref:Uncharacterized protein n=3 Tax=Mus musculus TaxID=10090 RepID=Q8C3D7_MOUSE|nr:unnamed protein product [Mus musculus]